MTNWKKDNFVEAIPRSIARLDFNQHREQHIKNYTAIENVLSKTKLEAEEPFSFLDLHDTPSSYQNQGGKFVRVKPSEDGLEFAEGAGGVGVIRESLYIPGWQRSSCQVISSLGSANLYGLLLYFIPFLNPSQFTTERICIYNISSQNINFRLALYSSIYEVWNPDQLQRKCYQPHQKLFESGNLSLVPTGWISSTMSVIMQPGVLFMAIAGSADFVITGYPGACAPASMGFSIAPTADVIIAYGFSLTLSNFDDPFPDTIPLPDLLDESLPVTDYIPLIAIS